MKNTVLNKPDVQAYYKQNFKSYAVDIEGDIEITDFEGNVMKQKEFATKKNRVRATPVLAFYDLAGKQVIKYIGKTSSLEEFMLLGQFMAEGHYKTSKFFKYKREQQGKLPKQ
jgi:thioredoxin-related protein